MYIKLPKNTPKFFFLLIFVNRDIYNLTDKKHIYIHPQNKKKEKDIYNPTTHHHPHPTMTMNQLGRILWRLRTKNPNNTRFHRNKLLNAIDWELGTDYRTHQRAINCLKRHQWITIKGNYIILTNKDLTGDDPQSPQT